MPYHNFLIALRLFAAMSTLIKRNKTCNNNNIDAKLFAEYFLLYIFINCCTYLFIGSFK